MSQAEDLLNSLSVEETATTVDEHIVIGTDRFITVPQRLKRIAVEYDHDVETVTFDCPRYWDGRDLTTMKLYINGFRADKEPFCYPIDNGVTIDAADNTMIHFDWIIKREVTEVRGGLVFLVCGKKVDADGNEENHWNSELNKDLYISEGLEVSDVIMNEYPDLVTHLLTRMNVVEYKTTLESMLGYLDTYFTTDAEINKVLQDYVSEYLQTSDEVTQKIADTVNAYIEEHLSATDKTLTVAEMPADAAATGDAVRNMVDVTNKTVLTETSAGVMKVNKVFGRSEQFGTSGKNLLNSNDFAARTVHGVTFTPVFYDNGLLHYVNVNGTATEVLIHLIGTIDLLANTAYNLSGCPTTGSNDTYGLTLRDSTGASVYTTEYGASANYIPTEDLTVYCYIRVASGATVSNLVFKPMVRLASITDDSYEPYTGGMPAPNPEYPQEIVNAGADGAVSGAVCGANLFSFDTIYSKLGNNSEITKSYSNNTLTLTGTPSGAYVQITSGRTTLPLPSYIRGKTMYFGATLSGNQPYVVLYFRDSAGGQIAGYNLTATGVQELVVPENAMYYEFAFCLNRGSTGTAYTATYSDIYLSFPNNGWAEYHEPQTVSIPTPNGLPGIKTTDASLANYTDEDGQMWICDEIDYKRGVYVQRIGRKVFTGAETWNTSSTTNGVNIRFEYRFNDGEVVVPAVNNQIGLIQSDQYISISADHTYLLQTGIAIHRQTATLGYMHIYNGMTSLSDFKASLAAKPMTVHYALATPIETPIDQIDTLRSYDGGTVIHQDDAVHAGLEVEYPRTLAASYILENQQDIAELQTPIRTATGEGSIKVTDSAAGGIQLVEMLGRSEQGSIAGNQLLDVSDIPTRTAADVVYTALGDGGFHINGTPTTYGNSTKAFTLASGTYILSHTGSQVDLARVRVLNASDGSLVKDYGNGAAFTFDAETQTLLFVMQVDPGWGTINETIYPMLNAGSTPLPWEPYCGGTPSPNPDYPQEIRSVVVSEVRVHGEQLFDKDNAHYKNLSIRETDYATTEGRTYYLKVKPNTTYTISKELGSFLRVVTSENEPGNGVAISQRNTDTSAKICTITTKEDDNYLAFYPMTTAELGTLSYEEVLATVMINYGTEALPLEEFRENSITLSQPIELNGIGDVMDELTPDKITQRVHTETIGADHNVLMYPYGSNGYNRFAVTLQKKCTAYKCMSSHFKLIVSWDLEEDHFYTEDDTVYFFTNKVTNVEDFKVLGVTIQYIVAEPIETPLPTADQIALRSLLSYDGVTYVELDAEVQGTMRLKYGTTEVGAVSLKADNLAECNEILHEENKELMNNVGDLFDGNYQFFTFDYTQHIADDNYIRQALAEVANNVGTCIVKIRFAYGQDFDYIGSCVGGYGMFDEISYYRTEKKRLKYDYGTWSETTLATQVYYDDSASDIQELLNKKCAHARELGSSSVCIYGGWQGISFGTFRAQVIDGYVIGTYVMDTGVSYNVAMGQNDANARYYKILTSSDFTVSGDTLIINFL